MQHTDLVAGVRQLM